MRYTTKTSATHRFLSALALLALLAPWPTGLAQAPQQPVQPQAPKQAPVPPAVRPLNEKGTIRAAVNLVEVDVQVTDKDGKPIKGLQQDQFLVSEDGKDQKVSTFDYYDVENIERAGNDDTAPVTVSIGGVSHPDELRQTLRDRRLIVLFFDLTSLQNDDLTRSTNAAKKFLKEQMTSADLVGVMAFGNQLNVLADFTNDRDLLNQAVDALLPGKESQLAALASASAFGNETAVSEDTDAAFSADETEFNIFNTDRKLIALESTADLLADVPGKKAVIQFTGGITQTGEDNRSQLRVTTDAANRANVSFYTVDSRGLMTEIPGGDASVGAASGNSMFSGASVFHQADAREDSRDTLATLATDTGGRSFFDLGDFAPAFRSVQADASGYYLLGYYSTNTARDGRWRTLKVRINGVSGAKIRYREGYYAAKDFAVYTTDDRERQLEDAIRSETPVVELPIAVDTSYFEIDKNQIFVPISAKIAASALQWAQKSNRRQVNFDFAAEIRGAQSNHVVGALRDTITVNLDAERFQQLQQNALQYQGGIVLPPGDYKLKFLARENETGRIGTFEDELKLPAASADHLQLSSVVLSSQLVEDQKNSEVKTKTYAPNAKMKESPLDVAGERIIPSVTRVFSAQQMLYIFFQAYVPEGADPNNLRAGIELFRSGRRFNQTPMVAPAQVDDKTRTASFRISLPLTGVPQGSYTVQAVVVEPGGAHAAFGRNYFALSSEPAVTPAAAPSPAPASVGTASGAPGGN
jgi:VWFA-related protein